MSGATSTETAVPTKELTRNAEEPINIPNFRQRLLEILSDPLQFIINTLRGCVRSHPKLQRILMQIVIDALTELPLRGALEEKFRIALGELKRGDMDACVIIMADLDFLRFINSTYGRVTGGDIVLKAVAGMLIHRIRAQKDIAVRWGGDEFAVLLTGFKADPALSEEVNRKSIIDLVARRLAELESAISGIKARVGGPGKEQSVSPGISIGAKVIFKEEAGLSIAQLTRMEI